MKSSNHCTGETIHLHNNFLSFTGRFQALRDWENTSPVFITQKEKRVWQRFGQNPGGEGLPYVGDTDMCHRPRSIFQFQKSRTGPEFWTFFPEQDPFWQSGLECQKRQLLSWKMTSPTPVFLKVCLSFSKRHWVRACQFKILHMLCVSKLKTFYHCG